MSDDLREKVTEALVMNLDDGGGLDAGAIDRAIDAVLAEVDPDGLRATIYAQRHDLIRVQVPTPAPGLPPFDQYSAALGYAPSSSQAGLASLASFDPEERDAALREAAALRAGVEALTVWGLVHLDDTHEGCVPVRRLRALLAEHPFPVCVGEVCSLSADALAHGEADRG